MANPLTSSAPIAIQNSGSRWRLGAGSGVGSGVMKNSVGLNHPAHARRVKP
jgi:hypothetical protein